MSTTSAVNSPSESDDGENVFVISPKTMESINRGITPLMTLSLDNQTKVNSVKDFQKVQLIGKGDVGRVYLAQRRKTQEYYAIKVMDKKLVQLRNKQKRVEEEKNILKSLNHPFIVKINWDFETDFYYYFVLTYCGGGDLYGLLSKQPGKCLREIAAKFYIAEILTALEYLHMEGIIYRDLKPENILVHESGHIMLSDFDLSKHCQYEEYAQIKSSFFKEEVVVEPQHFRSSSFVGTDEYLAPEIVNQEDHTASVDWWTLGVLLYEMLYGRNPFVGVSKRDTFRKITESKIQFPPLHRYTISKKAKDLMRKLLNPNPTNRLGSISGATEIKSSPFFDGFKFVLIRNMTPPIIPRLDNPTDTSYFYQFKTEDDDGSNAWNNENYQ
ncbi:non-specific serine/threonine protein kinase [Entamoeba marina]